jgi:hypothetical protein
MKVPRFASLADVMKAAGPALFLGLILGGCAESSAVPGSVPLPAPTELKANASAGASPSPSPSASPVNTAGGFVPGPAISPYAVSASHTVYVSSSNGNLYAVAQPLVAQSAVSPVAVNVPDIFSGLAVDGSGRLFAASAVRNASTFAISVFSTPLTASSLPALTFGTLDVDALAFDGSGDLVDLDMWDENQIDIYQPPFTAASTPAHVFFPSGVQDSTLALVNGRLYFSIQTTEEFVDPPYTSETSFPLTGLSAATSVIEAQAATADGSMIVASSPFNLIGVAGGVGSLSVYSLPLTASSAPAVTVTYPSGTSPTALGFDNQGRLIVGIAQCTANCLTSIPTLQAELLVYTLPLSGNSVPVTTIAIPNAPSVTAIVAAP